jgi:hypothetical protein
MKHLGARDLMSIAGGFMRRSYGIAFVAPATRFATACSSIIPDSAPDFTLGVSPEDIIVESIPSN